MNEKSRPSCPEVSDGGWRRWVCWGSNEGREETKLADIAFSSHFVVGLLYYAVASLAETASGCYPLDLRQQRIRSASSGAWTQHNPVYGPEKN